MIGFLRGTVLKKNSDSNQCVVLTPGLGYEVTVTARLFETLVEGTETSFWVHTHVREDALLLYGFGTETEKQFFRLLLGVSGFWPQDSALRSR